MNNRVQDKIKSEFIIIDCFWNRRRLLIFDTDTKSDQILVSSTSCNKYVLIHLLKNNEKNQTNKIYIYW